MDKVFIGLVLASCFLTGCANSESETRFNTIITFPVNQVCHDYVSRINSVTKMFEMEYKHFNIKLDAFPQILGFMELRSNFLLSVDLQNEAIKIMDKCFARAKTTISISNLESWLDVGRAVKYKTANDIEIQAIVLDGKELEIYYN